jgi:hypothetical protein
MLSVIRRNGKTAFYSLLLILLCLSLAWKPLVIAAWRLSHGASATVGARNIPIPFPWVLTREQGSAKARAFETLWPWLDNREVTVIVEETPPEQLKQLDAEWTSDRDARFRLTGYTTIRSESFFDGKILCAEASKSGVDLAYCRSSTKLNLIYSGPLKRLHMALAILPRN